MKPSDQPTEPGGFWLDEKSEEYAQVRGSVGLPHSLLRLEQRDRAPCPLPRMADASSPRALPQGSQGSGSQCVEGTLPSSRASQHGSQACVTCPAPCRSRIQQHSATFRGDRGVRLSWRASWMLPSSTARTRSSRWMPWRPLLGCWPSASPFSCFLQVCRRGFELPRDGAGMLFSHGNINMKSSCASARSLM